jgi:hypothetical protein
MPWPGAGPAIQEPGDNLPRASRPQRHASWLPRHRGWQDQTGVLQHEDHVDPLKQRTVWNEFGNDAQNGMSGRERRRVEKRRRLTQTSSGDAGEGDKEDGTATLPEASPCPSSPSISPAKQPQASKKMSTAESACDESARKLNAVKAPSRAYTIAGSKRSGENSDAGGQVWERTRLITRLKFAGRNIAILKRILAGVPATPSRSTRSKPCTTPSLRKTARTPAAATPTTPSSLRVLDSAKRLHSLPLFERQWKDETQNFNMKKVLESVRPGSKAVEELPALFTWFANAVPINALFPPGVPVSAREIHVREHLTRIKMHMLTKH